MLECLVLLFHTEYAKTLTAFRLQLANNKAAKAIRQGVGVLACLLCFLIWWFWRETGSIQKPPHYTTLLP
jgi:hypothetical protein